MHPPWPLQDIVSLQSLIVGVYHPLIDPPSCNAYPIAILLHDFCAICSPQPTPPVYAIHHTLLVMAMLCKGQIPTSMCLTRRGAERVAASPQQATLTARAPRMDRGMMQEGGAAKERSKAQLAAALGTYADSDTGGGLGMC